MAWGEGPLVERFEDARECLQAACPHWDLGTSYGGWLAAQEREAERLIAALKQKLRRHIQSLPGRQRVGRWQAFAVDGSDAACPRTRVNQAAMGDTGRPDGIPQLSMTLMYHLGAGLPWDFRVGPSSESERSHLREMLSDLPEGALLVADAGFIGYDLCREMLENKQHFLLRVGGNVHLLEALGYHAEIAGETVYLWPVEQQDRKQPPLRLRLIVIRDEGKQPIYLVTSVLDAAALTAEEARELYYQRWTIEVCYRTTKQTYDHARLRSRTPKHCYLEMRWALLGLWMLGLMTAEAAATKQVDPRDISHAAARRVVRRAQQNLRPRARRPCSLQAALAACVKDRYRRKAPKASRNYPRKKRHQPPGPPKIKAANAAQIQLAKQLTPLKLATL
jgi:hypothetical protein